MKDLKTPKKNNFDFFLLKNRSVFACLSWREAHNLLFKKTAM